MSNSVIVDLVAWIIVFPLALMIAAVIARCFIRRARRLKREEDAASAVVRYEEAGRAIREQWRQ